MFLQLWHVGRQSHISLQPHNEPPLAPSAIHANVRPLLKQGPGPGSMPRAIKVEEISRIVDEFRLAAELAKMAGFDGVEIHGANGYLIDQFLQDNSNRRTDEYGGPIENRARFMLEVVEAVVSVWSASRVGIRLAPSGTFGDMGDSDRPATFVYAVQALGRYGLAYLHVVEPRAGETVASDGRPPVTAATLRPRFGGPVIAAGGFEKACAEGAVERGDTDLIAFGRHFIANPDLPRRLRKNLPLNHPDRDTFYYGGRKGYVDYPFAEGKGKKPAKPGSAAG
jgi:N-ethylmaleimide reductase